MSDRTYPPDWDLIAREVKDAAGNCCVRCGVAHDPARGYCLTVHHFDGDKANCARWNLMALCQRCHLSVQVRVAPAQGFFFDPRPWAMPYIAGYYESGGGVKPPGYDLRRWVAEYYEADGLPWPAWAPP